MATLSAADLDVERIGAGPRVLFVHGSIVDARRTWRKQRELVADRELWFPNRPGFAGSPELERGDFELEAPLMAELLGAEAHLVGHSYGGVLALLAAALRPEAVQSLAVSEPGLLRLAAGDPVADEMIVRGEQMYLRGGSVSPDVFLRAFRAGVHSTHETPEDLPDWLERGARHAARERPSWHAEVPFEALAAADFPKLVISGGHSEVFEAMCDRLAALIGAERTILSGRGHTIPSLGEPYNSCLQEFWERAESRAGPEHGEPFSR